MPMRGSSQNNASFMNYWKDYPLTIDLRIRECGRESCDPLHFWGPARKVGYTIHYVTSGRGILSYRGSTYELGTGDGFVISPDYDAFYEADEHDPWSYRWLIVSGSQAKIILEMTSLLSTPIFHFDRDDRLVRYLDLIYSSSLDSKVPDVLMLGNTLLFLADLVKLFPSKHQLTYMMGKNYVQKASEYMEEHFSESFSINDVAIYVGVDRSYLYKLFQRHYGLSPTAYLEQVRLTHACRLLLDKDRSIQEVAYLCGYSDAGYFSTIFKKHKGVSPKKFASMPFESK